MLKKRLRNKVIKYLFNSIIVDDVISYNKKKNPMINGEELSEGEISNLKTEASQIKEMRLYEILYGTVAEKAKKTMFEKSMSFDDMIFGKMLLLSLDTQKRIVDRLAEDK